MSETKRPKYHQSAISTYLKCGLLYEFRYVHRLRAPNRANLLVGSSVDKAVNHHMTRKAQSLPTSVDEVLAVADDTFNQGAPETEWAEEESRDQQKDITLSLARLHFEKVAPSITPKTVQEEFIIEMEGGYDLGGTIDVTDTHDFVRDTKTSARQSAGIYQIERSFQPAMYDFAFRALRGRPPAGFKFDILKKPTKTIAPEYEMREGRVTEADHDWLFQSIDQVHKGITAGVALPAPEGSWYCSAKYCSYWNICKGKKS